MSYTNKQAALIAASNIAGDNVQALKIADEFLTWLDAGTFIVPAPQEHNLDKLTTVKRPAQCDDRNSSGARCDLPADHAGKHENDHDSSVWGWVTGNGHRTITKPPAPARHFKASRFTHRTVCGIEDDPKTPHSTTTDIGATTCAQCKEELGL